MDLEMKRVDLMTGEETPIVTYLDEPLCKISDSPVTIVRDEEGASRWDDDRKAVKQMQYFLKTLPQDFAVRLAQENRPLTIKEFCMACLTTNSTTKLKLLDFFLSQVRAWPKDETPLGSGESTLLVHRNKEVAVCQEIEKAFVPYKWKIERKGKKKIYTTRHKLSFDICDAVRDVHVKVLGLADDTRIDVIGIEHQYMGMTRQGNDDDEDEYVDYTVYTVDKPSKKLLPLKRNGDCHKGYFPGIFWIHYPWRESLYLEIAIESDRIPQNIEVYFTYKNYVLDNLCREAISDMAKKIEIKVGEDTCELIFKSGGEVRKTEPMYIHTNS